MIQTKFFEIRDIGTFIPVVCHMYDYFNLKGKDQYLFRRAGWKKVITYTRLNDFKTYKSVYDMTDTIGRTDRVAYEHIYASWSDLESGDVIDVALILGLTEELCESEYEGQYE